MIGAGTGIAPFRAFLQERSEAQMQGRNWLFFGEQRFKTDFLYQTELQDYASTGVLTKISTAFSRDQRDKIYVQHRMQEHAQDLYEWIAKGAYIYVCGDKARMANDVNETLIGIIAAGRQIDKQQAQVFLAGLEDEGRYLKDVY